MSYVFFFTKLIVFSSSTCSIRMSDKCINTVISYVREDMYSVERHVELIADRKSSMARINKSYQEKPSTGLSVSHSEVAGGQAYVCKCSEQSLVYCFHAYAQKFTDIDQENHSKCQLLLRQRRPKYH